MEGFEQDDEGYWQVSEGWRSWNCVVTLSSYIITLVVMTWFTIMGFLAVLPFITLAMAIGFVIYLMLSTVR